MGMAAFGCCFSCMPRTPLERMLKSVNKTKVVEVNTPHSEIGHQRERKGHASIYS